MGVVTTLAGTVSAGNGNGIGNAASFNLPRGVAVDANSNVYVADNYNHSIRKVTPLGNTTTLAGGSSSGNTDGIGSSASFSFPNGLAVDAAGYVYVADRTNNEIRKVSSTGVVTTLAGNGQSGNTDGAGSKARFNGPLGVAVDATRNVYVADAYNNKIRKVSPTGVVTTLAGNGNVGNSNGIGSNASFNSPTGVAVDSSGNIYVADNGNNIIRKISLGFNISPTLPTGLIFEASTGIISGTPTIAIPTTTYTVTAINDSGIGSWPLQIAATLPLPLPITLTTFTARPTETNQIKTEWQTATEVNSSHFIVEQSSDDQTFTAKGTVKAVGSGANRYSFDVPFSSPSGDRGVLYFRLKMIDKDGSYEYSKVVSVTLTTHHLPLITITPNPAHNTTTVSIHLPKAQTIQYQLINTEGKPCGSVQKQALPAGKSSFPVSLNGLVKGIYWLKIEGIGKQQLVVE